MESLEMMRMDLNRETKGLEVRVDQADERTLDLDARLKASTFNAEALSMQNQQQYQQLAFLHHAGVGEVRYNPIVGCVSARRLRGGGQVIFRCSRQTVVREGSAQGFDE
jgi:hypothetical protein